MKDFISELKDINTNKLINEGTVLIGLDIGDKTIGVSISDKRIRIASGITTIKRNQSKQDFVKLKDTLNQYKVGCIIFGWPVQMNGLPGSQCEKTLKFIEGFYNYLIENNLSIPEFSYWDERLSTCAVTYVLKEADLSRKKRKQVIDKNAAVYILQGVIDFLNRSR